MALRFQGEQLVFCQLMRKTEPISTTCDKNMTINYFSIVPDSGSFN